MTVLYLQEQGSVLKKSSNRIVVALQGETLLEVPVFQLQRVLIFGNIQVTTQALGLLLEQGVDVAFFNQAGRLRGTVVSDLSKNIFVRLAQHAVWQDPQKKLCLARQIVSAKIHNQTTVLKSYLWQGGDEELRSAVKALQNYQKSLDSRDSIAGVSGVEGILSRVYFSQFDPLLRSGLQFQGRTRRPPTDPVNSLLSLGYSLLTAELASLLEGASFDPYLGFFHGIRYGRKSLALDIVEQFRQPVIDTFTLTLCNKRMFAEKDFTKRDEDEGLYLQEESLKRYFSLYEERLRKKGKQGSSWREIISQNVDSLHNAMVKNEEYVLFIMKQ